MAKAPSSAMNWTVTSPDEDQPIQGLFILKAEYSPDRENPTAPPYKAKVVGIHKTWTVKGRFSDREEALAKAGALAHNLLLDWMLEIQKASKQKSSSETEGDSE